MPLFLLANWKWLIPLALSIALGGGWAVTYLRLEHLQLADAQALQRATEAARAQEAKQASLAQEIELAHQDRDKALQQASDNIVASAHTNGLWVRAKCPNPAGQGTHTSPDSDGTTQVRLSAETGDALIALARDADRAAEYARTCHEWAEQIGAK